MLKSTVDVTLPPTVTPTTRCDPISLKILAPSIISCAVQDLASPGGLLFFSLMSRGVNIAPARILEKSSSKITFLSESMQSGTMGTSSDMSLPVPASFSPLSSFVAESERSPVFFSLASSLSALAPHTMSNKSSVIAVAGP